MFHFIIPNRQYSSNFSVLLCFYLGLKLQAIFPILKKNLFIIIIHRINIFNESILSQINFLNQCLYCASYNLHFILYFVLCFTLYIQNLMFLFNSCKISTVLFGQSIGEQALISGISDVIVVKYPNGIYKSTPFLVCFGSHSILNRQQQIKIQINDSTIINTNNKVNRHGYMKNVFMTQLQIQKMDLQWGKNRIKYILNHFELQAQLWLLKITDKILISDFDGTVTKTDFGGLMGGILDYQMVHPGYTQLMQKLSQRNVYLIWVTMRSLPFYNMSKKYLTKYLNSNGIILMQPEEFLPAIKKQLFKKTGNIKANIIKTIGSLFPQDVKPFVGGLGNRQNDAIAYLNIGIKIEYIYLVSSSSHVQRMSSKKFGLTYKMMASKVDKYFDLIDKNYLSLPSTINHDNFIIVTSKHQNFEEIMNLNKAPIIDNLNSNTKNNSIQNSQLRVSKSSLLRFFYTNKISQEQQQLKNDQRSQTRNQRSSSKLQITLLSVSSPQYYKR